MVGNQAAVHCWPIGLGSWWNASSSEGGCSHAVYRKLQQCKWGVFRIASERCCTERESRDRLCSLARPGRLCPRSAHYADAISQSIAMYDRSDSTGRLLRSQMCRPGKQGLINGPGSDGVSVVTSGVVSTDASHALVGLIIFRHSPKWVSARRNKFKVGTYLPASAPAKMQSTAPPPNL